MEEKSGPRRILLVAYHFPPAGGIAVQRILSLARHLPEHGFEVHVLTTRNPSTGAYDPSLAGRIPPQVRVHRAFAPALPHSWRLSLLRWMKGGGGGPPPPDRKQTAARPGLWMRLLRRSLSPDPQIVWYPFALRKAKQLIERFQFQTVLITVPPFSSLRLGPALKKRFPRIRLVCDFRDEWIDFFLPTFYPEGGDALLHKAQRMEQAAMDSSSLAVGAVEFVVSSLHRRYPAQPAEKLVCIPNGYEPSLFAGFRSRPHGTGKIRVTYTGTLYSATSARYYLEALDTLPAEVRSRFETHFIGNIAGDEADWLRNRGSTVIQHGFLPQQEVLRLVEETDYLLITMLDRGFQTGKIFEYLATGKPILAFTPKVGALGRLLEETQSGWSTEPGDLAGAQTMLRRAAELSGKAVFTPDWERIRSYERPRLVAEYARRLRAIET